MLIGKYEWRRWKWKNKSPGSDNIKTVYKQEENKL